MIHEALEDGMIRPMRKDPPSFYTVKDPQRYVQCTLTELGF